MFLTPTVLHHGTQHRPGQSRQAGTRCQPHRGFSEPLLRTATPWISNRVAEFLASGRAGYRLNTTAPADKLQGASLYRSTDSINIFDSTLVVN